MTMGVSRPGGTLAGAYSNADQMFPQLKRRSGASPSLGTTKSA